MSEIMAPPSSHRLLRVGRIVWMIYAVAILALSLASLPGYYERVITGTVSDTVSFDLNQPAGNEFFTARAAAAGLPLPQFITANIGISLLILGVHYVVAGLVDNMGVVVRLLIDLGALVWPIFPIWLYLFPDGRAVPRWARWPIIVLMGVFAVFMVTALLDTAGVLPPALWQAVVTMNERTNFVFVLVLPGVALALVSQIYRYLRVSGPVERQQTKWFIFGLALFVAFFPLSALGVVRRLDAISGSFGLVFIPITITIAIALLRYRLWDVDVVVRRMVGYAVLTSLLALVYFGSIVVLQRLLAPFSGDSTLATILSTLLIAGLSLPLRRRVQELIDRRFYRRKYNAAKVLEGFAATARDETDLEMLTAELLRVIRKTMEPEHVSIWLKSADTTPIAQRPMSAYALSPILQDPHVHNS